MTRAITVIKQRIVRALIYQTPIGSIIRRIRKTISGGKKPEHATAAYWDQQLVGRFAPYLGGTITVDTRNAITRVLLDHVAPHTTSVLDVGCAGGALLMALDGGSVKTYLGLDISKVAIDRATSTFGNSNEAWKHARFRVSGLVEHVFADDERYDLIVFNEVLYYLDIDEVANHVNRYSRALTPEGRLLISLKNDPKSHAILRQLLKHHDWVYGIIYQQQATEPAFKVVLNTEMPAYLVGILAPKPIVKTG